MNLKILGVPTCSNVFQKFNVFQGPIFGFQTCFLEFQRVPKRAPTFGIRLEQKAVWNDFHFPQIELISNVLLLLKR